MIRLPTSCNSLTTRIGSTVCRLSLYPYAYWQLANNGAMKGFSIFPYGMTMNYWRTHNELMLDAVNTLATAGPQYRVTGSVDPYSIRENAYRANMWMANSQVGAAQSPLLQRNIDKLIGISSWKRRELERWAALFIRLWLDLPQRP
jgi:hypothetical protein